MSERLSPPNRRLLWIAIGLVVFWFVWFQWKLLFLAFAGMLLAILLHSAAAWVERHTPLNPVLSYLATLVAIAAILAALVLVLGPRLITQLTEVIALLPKSINQATTFLQHSAWGNSLLNVLHQAMRGIHTGAKLTVLAKEMLSMVVDLVVVLVIGFFAALNPRAYCEGLLLLVPEDGRDRARRLSSKVAHTLRFWLLGQLVSMTVLGVASMIALWILGVHLAFTLGLMTGAAIFIPYLGTLASSIPAILLALQVSPRTALYVLILYSVFHMIEGYFLTPLVQRRAVRLPPVLTVLAEFFMWSFAGILGVAIAAPLTAVSLTLARELFPRGAAPTS